MGKPFVVHTDHLNLTFIKSETKAKVQRWHIELSEYDFEIKHVSGKNNAFADALSRVGHQYVTQEWPEEKLKAERDLLKKLWERESQRKIAAMTITNLGHAPEVDDPHGPKVQEFDYDTESGIEMIENCLEEERTSQRKKLGM
ncbi:hypothetical protein ADUPG1_003365, partial [Aduncisulcus paluster]